jgi:hypothetical protein
MISLALRQRMAHHARKIEAILREDGDVSVIAISEVLLGGPARRVLHVERDRGGLGCHSGWWNFVPTVDGELWT